MDFQENENFEQDLAPEEEVAEPAERKKSNWWKGLIAAVLVVALIALGSGATAAYLKL